MLADGYSRETQAQVEAWEAKTAEELGRLEKETTRLMATWVITAIVPAETNMSDFWRPILPRPPCRKSTSTGWRPVVA